MKRRRWMGLAVAAFLAGLWTGPAAAETAKEILQEIDEARTSLRPLIEKNALAEARVLGQKIVSASQRLIDNPGLENSAWAHQMKGAARELKVNAEIVAKSAADGNAIYVQFGYKKLNEAYAKVIGYYENPPQAAPSPAAAPAPVPPAMPSPAASPAPIPSNETVVMAPDTATQPILQTQTDTAVKASKPAKTSTDTAAKKAKPSDTAAAKAKPTVPPTGKKAEPKKK